MKSYKNILIAFFMNLFFSIIELVGGILTGSISIISDALHDFGDSLSIGVSFFLEKISYRKPNEKFTYGYLRFSVLGGVIQSAILLVGSILVIYNAVIRIINPITINYEGMILLGVIGLTVNLIAAHFTKDGGSINQKAINLHMLEDVFGWMIVLFGAFVMKFTDFLILDSLLSIFLALFIIVNAIKNLIAVLNIFLQKTPDGIDVNSVKQHLLNIEGVKDVHHLHIWSIDGYSNLATLHAVIADDENSIEIKSQIKAELNEHGISHSTVELEKYGEECSAINCVPNFPSTDCVHNHHHHH